MWMYELYKSEVGTRSPINWFRVPFLFVNMRVNKGESRSIMNVIISC